MQVSLMNDLQCYPILKIGRNSKILFSQNSAILQKLNCFWKQFSLRDPLTGQARKFGGNNPSVNASLLQPWSCWNDFSLQPIFPIQKHCHGLIQPKNNSGYHFWVRNFWLPKSTFLACWYCQKQLKIKILIKNGIILILQSALR